MTRTINKGNIQLRKLISISKSLGIVIPSKFVEKMQLKSGQYTELELHEESKSFSVEKLRLG